MSATPSNRFSSSVEEGSDPEDEDDEDQTKKIKLKEDADMLRNPHYVVMVVEGFHRVTPGSIVGAFAVKLKFKVKSTNTK